MESLELILRAGTGITGGLIALLIAVVAARSRTRADGWTYVTPGPLLYFCQLFFLAALIGCLGVSVFLMHNNSPPTILAITILCVANAGLASISWWYFQRISRISRIRVRFTADHVSWLDGKTQYICKLTGIRAHKLRWKGLWHVWLPDGHSFLIDHNARGIDDLLNFALEAREDYLLDMADEELENRGDIDPLDSGNSLVDAVGKKTTVH